MKAGPLGRRGRRLSEDVGHLRRSREQQKGLAGRELVPSSGSRRSVSSSRLEQRAEKGGTAIKQKGLLSVTPRGQNTERSREDLHALKTEVLTLRRRLDASECQRRTLLETCWHQQRTRTWASERQAPLLGLRAISWQKKRDAQEDQSGGKARVLDGRHVAKEVEGDGGKLGSEAEKEKEVSPRGKAELGVQEEVQGETERQVPAVEQPQGKTPPLAEEEDLSKDQSLVERETRAEGKFEPEGNMEALREDLRVLAAGKAEAEAQASLVQRKLQNLQATLGRQTERLAQAMETQSHHVEELLADAEEKECLMESLRQELEDTKEALEMANTEGQRLRALLEQREKEANPTTELGMGDVAKPQAQLQEGRGGAGADSLADEPPPEAKLSQLEASLAQLVQENQALRNELARWEARSLEGRDDGTPDSLRSLCSGNDGEAEAADVLRAARKRGSLPEGSRRDVQTQTEGPEGGHRRRERVSVAFDDTQYEPYGLPEVVMKGFADIPSGPSCPYVLRRGILGSAPVAQLAPRAEPEEDSLEADEGTGV